MEPEMQAWLDQEFTRIEHSQGRSFIITPPKSKKNYLEASQDVVTPKDLRKRFRPKDYQVDILESEVSNPWDPVREIVSVLKAKVTRLYRQV